MQQLINMERNPETTAPINGWQQMPDAGTSGLFRDDWLLQFAKHLQTTLRVEQLLEVFVEDTMDAIPYDGLQFQHVVGNLNLKLGDDAPHSCAYELVLSDENIGRLTFYRNTPFNDTDTNRVEFLISHLLYPLRNALLYRQALVAAAHDPLTGTLNRSALGNTLPREIRLARRYNNPLAVMMLDLDRFKRVNDRYGHITGDCVLKAFVERVANQMRLSDILFRYGGEEFLVLLTNTGMNGAMLLAERIRRGVEEMRINCDGVLLRVTVSIGVSMLSADDTDNQLIERADLALYASKTQGRNRVTNKRVNTA